MKRIRNGEVKTTFLLPDKSDEIKGSDISALSSWMKTKGFKDNSFGGGKIYIIRYLEKVKNIEAHMIKILNYGRNLKSL